MSQRDLREILLLPPLDREREQRAIPDRRKVYGIVAALVLVSALIGISFFVYAHLNRVIVPNIQGMTEEQAALQLQAAGIRFEVTSRKFSDKDIGTVLEQRPSVGSSLSPFGSVSLVVSAGTDEVRVPNLIGENEEYARSVLDDMGLNALVMEVSSSRPPGSIVRLDPSVGSLAVTGDTITLMVSALREEVPLAEYDLKDKNIALVVLSEPSLDKDAPLDVSLRLSALLQAAGAEVATVANISDITDATAFDSAVVLSVRTNASRGGVEISGPKKDSDRVLAASIFEGLEQSAKDIRETNWKEALIAGMAGSNQVELSLGNAGSSDDSNNLREDSFLDLIARGIYIGIGETLSK